MRKGVRCFLWKKSADVGEDGVGHALCIDLFEAVPVQVGGAVAFAEGRFHSLLDFVGGGVLIEEYRRSMAAERMVAQGLAMPCPAMSGAEPWIGS